MRRIVVGAMVSLDGVMQAPGGPTEDPTNGFKFGGWVMPYFDQHFGEELDRVFKEKFDLLLGRKTYEIFAAYWPYYDEGAPNGGIAKLFNRIKKYAVSRSGVVHGGLLIGYHQTKQFSRRDELMLSGLTVPAATGTRRPTCGSTPCR